MRCRIPIQALTIRQRSESGAGGKERTVQAAAPATRRIRRKRLQGVFVIRNKKDAEFVPVDYRHQRDNRHRGDRRA